MSYDGHFAATGCVRSTGADQKKNEYVKTTFNAVIHIWSTAATNYTSKEPTDSINGYIMTIGNGFFERAVSSVALSQDMSLICGIGADDYHRMGIWSLSGISTKKSNVQSAAPVAVQVAEVNCLHGLPLELTWLSWCPGLHKTGYISKDHGDSGCDLMVTAG